MPGFEETAGVSRWNMWFLAWHGILYGTLAAATVSTLIDPSSPTNTRIAVTVSVLLVAWVGYWMGLRPDALVSRTGTRMAFLTVSGALWAVLLASNRTYSLLAFVAYGLVFGYLGRRASLIGAILVAMLLIGAEGLDGSLGARGGLGWSGIDAGDVAGQLLILAVLTLLFVWVRDVIRQSTERQRLVDELQAARDELAIAERQAGMLNERQRLAAEIHDTVTQELASVVMLLEAALAASRAGSSAAQQQIEQALRSSRESLREVRGLVWSLRPEALERGTLGDALARLCTELSAQTGIVAHSVVTGTLRAATTEVEVTILRAAQEALANVRRHARAGEVAVTLSYMDDVVALDVRDDGLGFEPELLSGRPGRGGGLGLVAMKERVASLGGSLAVESAPGEGTTVVVSIPLEPQTEASLQARDAAVR